MEVLGVLAVYGMIWLLGMFITEYRYRNIGKRRRYNDDF